MLSHKLPVCLVADRELMADRRQSVRAPRAALPDAVQDSGQTCKRHMKLEGRARPGSHSEAETRLESRIHGWQEQHCLRAASPRLRPALRPALWQTSLTGLKPPGGGGRGGTHGYKSNSGLQQKRNRPRIQKEMCLSASGPHTLGKCLVSV